MKELATNSIKAAYRNISFHNIDNTFELFGLDFMIDATGKVYLIEVNTNPCLEMNSPLLSRLIPKVLENTFKIAVDPIFPPPELFGWAASKKYQIPENILEHNKFELIFDEEVEGRQLKDLYAKFKSEENNLGNAIYEIQEDSDNEENEF